MVQGSKFKAGSHVELLLNLKLGILNLTPSLPETQPDWFKSPPIFILTLPIGHEKCDRWS